MVMLVVEGYELLLQMPQLSMWNTVTVIALMLPGWSSFLMPFAVFGALIALINHMYTHRTLLGLMVSGMKPVLLFRCLWPWLLFIGIVTVVGVLYIMPQIQKHVLVRMGDVAAQQFVSQMEPGQFHVFKLADKDTVIYLDRSNDKVNQVMVMNLDTKNKAFWQFTHAKNMRVAAKQFQLFDGQQWVHQSQDRQEPWKHVYFNSYSVPVNYNHKHTSFQSSASIQDLWQDRQNVKSAIDLNSRISTCLMVIVMSILPFITVRASTKPMSMVILLEGGVLCLFYLILVILTHSVIKRTGWSWGWALMPHVLTLTVAMVWYGLRMSRLMRCWR